MPARQEGSKFAQVRFVVLRHGDTLKVVRGSRTGSEASVLTRGGRRVTVNEKRGVERQRSGS